MRLLQACLVTRDAGNAARDAETLGRNCRQATAWNLGPLTTTPQPFIGSLPREQALEHWRQTTDLLAEQQLQHTVGDAVRLGRQLPTLHLHSAPTRIYGKDCRKGPLDSTTLLQHKAGTQPMCLSHKLVQLRYDTQRAQVSPDMAAAGYDVRTAWRTGDAAADIPWDTHTRIPTPQSVLGCATGGAESWPPHCSLYSE